MWNLILWLSIIWLAPLMYFVLGNEISFKKNIAVGVTLPFEGRQDHQVLARLSRFKKELGVLCFLLLLLALPCMLVKGLARNMMLWFLWLDLCVFLPFIPYVRCNRDLKRIKRQRGWSVNAGQTLTVDTAAVGAGRWLSPWLFLPPLLLCLLPQVSAKLAGKRTALFLVGFVWTSLVAASRIVMGAHYLTDTIVGLAVGLLALAGSCRVFCHLYY